jgi:hypothetical protein
MLVFPGNPLGSSIQGSEIAISSQAAGDILYFNGTSWVRLAKGTALQYLRTNAGATAPEWASNTSALTLISTSTLAADGTFSFQNIPSGYKMFILQCYLEDDGSGAGNAGLRFNNDSGNNYGYNQVYGNAANALASSAAAQSYALIGDLGAANCTYLCEVLIYNTTAALTKNGISNGGRPSGNDRVNHVCISWTNVANEISRIDVMRSANSYDAGSRVDLWGVS